MDAGEAAIDRPVVVITEDGRQDIIEVAAVGEAVETAVEGVYDLKKVASQAWAAGDKIYWDNTAKNTTKTLTSNTLIGVATEAVAGGATDLIGRVRLNGAF